jgi:hypothetical protein
VSEDLSAIEKLATVMLASLAPAERRRALVKVARHVQASQRARIGRQQDPDGRAYVKRRKKAPPAPGAYPLRFLYPKGAAEPRLVFMKSWVRQHDLVTGYDIEVGAIRSFHWAQIAKFLPVPAGEGGAGGKLRRKGRIRERAMFRKLSSSRFLKAGATESEAWIGFDGRIAAIAEIHQDGLEDKPAPRAKAVRYSRRALLGLTPAEEAAALNVLLNHVTERL